MDSDWNNKGIKRAKLGAIIVLVLAFGGFGIWSATASISGSVIASGSVKVLKNRKSVQHNEGGIVEEILVSDGDVVTSGQVIIRLDATRARNSFDLLKNRKNHILATISRLEAELRLEDKMTMPKSSLEDQHQIIQQIQNQTPLLVARLQMIHSSEEMIDEQIAQMGQQTEGLKSKVTALEYQIESMKNESQDLEMLFKKGLTSRTKLLELQRETANLEGLHAETGSQIGSVKRSIAEANQNRSRIKAEFHERANSELTESQRQLNEIIEQMETAAHSLALSEIRATAAGIVVGLSVHTVGGIIAPGELLLEILPEEQGLLVEAKVEVKDIDLVHMGQTVDLKFVSSKARSLDNFSSKLTYVSADSLFDEQIGKSYFLVRAELNENEMDKELLSIIQPGLSAEVFINTGARTPLQYLVKPLEDSISRAWKES